MKSCPYCGARYADDVLQCAIDGHSLPGLEPPPPPESEPAAVPPEPLANDAVYPEYQWSARDAWKCIGMIIIFYFVSGLVLLALHKLSPAFGRWQWSPAGYLLNWTFILGTQVVTVAYFARTESLASFCQAVGLDRKPSEHIWFGIVATLGLMLLTRLAQTVAHIKGYTPYHTRLFMHTAGPERYLYILTLLMAPFLEEPIMRGFLYRAFRKSYSVALSTLLIVCFTAY